MTDPIESTPSDSAVVSGVSAAQLSEQAIAPEKVIPNNQDVARPSNAEPLKLESLDPASVTAERLAGGIFISILLFALLIGLAIVAFNFGINDTITICCGAAFLLVASGLAWLNYVLPRKEFEHAGWCLTKWGLEIRRGVWWRSQISVPLVRVQHTDVHQGPLQRRFGIAKLTIHTAGTEHSAVEINGLNFATAQRLRDALIENRGDIDGV